jgi:fatty-acyl-CoA synthase
VPVPREVTQAILDRLSAATLRHVPGQSYTVGDRLEERAAAHPDKAFVRFEDRVVDYGAANVYANRVAHAARALGLRRGDVAALVMENRPEFLGTWMAREAGRHGGAAQHARARVAPSSTRSRRRNRSSS